MRLWNEYEGTTIAGIFPVEKLLRPEGRSAFFSTSNGTGTPAVLRLIESINDEAEILSRWQVIADLKDAHLITLKKFGQTIFEDTPLIYVLMEAADGDLSSILQERPLTVEETREIANSLVDALQALHTLNIVHEHVEPSNVMAAAGDIVKLRSDCVRDAPEGEEGLALKKKDVHDFAVVLLQALTQQKTLNGISPTRLPPPFDPIIRNGISGAWGLKQIKAALHPPIAIPRSPLVPMQSGQTAQSGQTVQALQPAPAAALPAMPPAATTTPTATPRPASITAPTVRTQQAAPEKAVPVASIKPLAEPPHQQRITVPVDEDPTRRRLWVAIAPVVIVIAAALGWHALHKTSPAADTQPVTTLAEVDKPAGPAPNTTPAPPTAVPAPDTTPAPALSTGDVQHPWRVVAYTYNRRDQAQHKAETIAQRDSGLRPEVFSPHGGSPFLVTLGGAMTHDEAAAFRQKAQSEGLPRDIYIQNYESREQRHARRQR